VPDSSDCVPVESIDSQSAFKTLTDSIASASKRQPSWTRDDWPTEQLSLIANAQVYRWFVDQRNGGLEWSASDIAKGYIALGSACLTSTFIVTQRVAALKRVASCDNAELKQLVLPGMLDGSGPGTVGISHLTTSRRHTKQPVMRVTREGDHWRVNGFAPWVTGASHAKWLLVGGVLEDGNEILFLLPTNAAGVKIEKGFELIALSASHTGAVKCNSVILPDANVVIPPRESVLATSSGTGAGSVQTSALALGLVRSAIDFIREESDARPDLTETAQSLDQQFDLLFDLTVKVADGAFEHSGKLRADANSLATRSTQAAMIAAKGAGFVEGHPVGRWCREALFFLVWSCPQQVAEAGLCELVTLR
jgi:alkylation response protein AidB-like acyl-CoA dehydrogenase